MRKGRQRRVGYYKEGWWVITTSGCTVAVSRWCPECGNDLVWYYFSYGTVWNSLMLRRVKVLMGTGKRLFRVQLATSQVRLAPLLVGGQSTENDDDVHWLNCEHRSPSEDYPRLEQATPRIGKDQEVGARGPHPLMARRKWETKLISGRNVERGCPFVASCQTLSWRWQSLIPHRVDTYE